MQTCEEVKEAVLAALFFMFSTATIVLALVALCMFASLITFSVYKIVAELIQLHRDYSAALNEDFDPTDYKPFSLRHLNVLDGKKDL